jgi:hypothetical protein
VLVGLAIGIWVGLDNALLMLAVLWLCIFSLYVGVFVVLRCSPRQIHVDGDGIQVVHLKHEFFPFRDLSRVEIQRQASGAFTLAAEANGRTIILGIAPDVDTVELCALLRQSPAYAE